MTETDRKATLARRAAILSAAGMPPAVRTRIVPGPKEVATRETPRARAPLCLALIATRSYLPFAQVLARSFRQHHQSVPIFLLMPDGIAGDAELFPRGRVFLLDELQIENVGWYAAKYTASEFSNALKPAFLRFLSDWADRAIYLDTDIGVFSPLTELIEALDTASLVLTPHTLAPFLRPEQFWVHPNTADIFNSGLINAGCFALRLHDCDGFLQKWHQYNTAPGAFCKAAGYQTDQQYLNWALMMVPDVVILRHTRYNVAYWNLHDRSLRVEYDGGGEPLFFVDGESLACFHFSGYDVNDRLTLSRFDGRYSVYDIPAVAEILNLFSDAVFAAPSFALLNTGFGLDHWGNGFIINRFIREILKRYEPYLPRVDVRSKAGADQLCGILMDPLPAATGSMLPLVAAEIYQMRSDLHVAFPNAHTNRNPSAFWFWFCRHAGREFEIDFLIDNFRRALSSDSVAGFAESVVDTLPEDSALQFLGADRRIAAEQLQAAGRSDLADTLLEARTEWYFFSDMGAILAAYDKRTDLQRVFPDILDRDHAAFADWLTEYGRDEQDIPPSALECFGRRNASETLARVYSYLARRTDLIDARCEALLLDDMSPLLRDIVRGSGEGLEYDLDDLVTLQFIHQCSRHLLVPLFLELPFVRRRPEASRLKEKTVALLPESVRSQEWALRGCRLHESYFVRIAAMLGEQVNAMVAARTARKFDVGQLLRDARPAQGSDIGVPADVAAAAKRLAGKAPKPAEYIAHLQQREANPAVNIFGYFFTDNGVGESSRGLALALSKVRPVNPLPLYSSHVRAGVTLSQMFQRYDHLSDTNVFVSYPHQREDLLGVTPPACVLGRRNIAHLAWEQRDFNPWWKIVYDRYDEIWAISEFAATPFRKLFPGRVRVIPNVLPFEDYPRCEESGERSDEVMVKFLFAFDANSSMERKNPEGVIAAFVLAFQGTPEAKIVRLTLKVGGLHRAEHADRVRKLMQQAQRSGLYIQFDGRQLARDDLMQLIADADCYVSLHRAEGFGYTMAEAMFYEVPVIASGYSGNLEYMNENNSFLVPCREALVKTPDGPFQRGSIWAEPDIEAAAELMRLVVANPSTARKVGVRGGSTVRHKLSATAVAEVIRGSFDSLPRHQLAAE